MLVKRAVLCCDKWRSTSDNPQCEMLLLAESVDIYGEMKYAGHTF